MEETNSINGLLLILAAIVLIIRNWLLINAERILNGKETINVLKAYSKVIFTIKPFLAYPIIKKTNNKKVNLKYFYSNLLVLVFYSLILNIIVNVIYSN